MPFLITGASGFIGRHLCARLTADGHHVLALMRRPQQLPALREQIVQRGGDGQRLDAVAGDLTSPSLGLTAALPALDGIIHLGAHFAWQLDRNTARATNVAGSLAVAELARHQRCRLVLISGFMLENHDHLQRLGIQADAPDATDWQQVYRRAGGYEASKLEAALRVRALAGQLDLVEVQPATVAGHSHTGDLDPAQPLYSLIDNLARGRLTMVPGTPAHWLPLVPVDHLAALITAAATATNPPRRLLALDPATPNLQPMLASVAAVLGRRAPRRHLPMPVLAALLRIPGLPRLMNTWPEALHFIQPTRFDTAVTESFEREQGLTPPPIQTALDASTTFYQRQQRPA